MRIIRVLEERELISMQPELYRGLMEEATKVFENEIKRAKEEVKTVKDLFKSLLSLKNVNIDNRLVSISSVGSDASRCPMPLLATRTALISGIALRHPSNVSPSILKQTYLLALVMKLGAQN